MRYTTISKLTTLTLVTLVCAPLYAQTPNGDGGIAPDGAGAPDFPDAAQPDGTDAGLKSDATPPAPAAPVVPPVAAPPAAPEVVLEAGADRQTGIRGRVSDTKTGALLKAVPVLARGEDGKTRTTLTDEGGAFVFYLPPGTYMLRAYYTLYHGVRMRGVRVTRGAVTSARLVLDPIDITQDVAVTEIEIPYRADTTTVAAQDQLRKESRGIGEGMGSQQMSQQGAGDAGAAARRVVGVTVESNQLVIRGLGGRYVRVFLNGLPIPNTDPDFPSVDLDLFPTAVIDNLNIQKVFLPEVPGDFAGGILDITTVSFPRKFVFTVGVGSAYNTQTTFKDRLTYDGGKTDWLGFDDGTRKLPSLVDGRRLVRPTRGPGPFPFPDEASFQAAGDQFQNTWSRQTTGGLPQLGLNATVGDAINLSKKRRFGYLASVVYDYAAERIVGVTRPRPRITPEGELQELNRYDVEAGNLSVQLAAIGTASLDLGPDNSLTALSMYNRSMDDQTRLRLGINADASSTLPFEGWQLRFLTRTVFVNQLLGDHRNLGGTRLRLRWSGYYALGERQEPDQRIVNYGYLGGVDRRWRPTANRLWSDLTQHDYGANAQLRFPLWPSAWGNIGGRATFSEREFSTRRFQVQERSSVTDPNIFSGAPESILGPDALGVVTDLVEFTKTNDSYSARQRGYAGFLSVETPLFGPLSASGGARVEFFSQEVQAKSPLAADNTPEMLAMNRTERSDVDILPGVALKYAVSDTMIVRAAYGLTLSRPQARELASYDYYDFLRDRIVIGNPELKTARIQNTDLRWEWFYAEGQVVAVSGFYKRFTDPIELQIVEPSRYDSQYVNAKSATNFGAEFELRSELGILSKALRRFAVGGNVSLVDSRIELEEVGSTRTGRRLAGQAPYVLNVSVRYAVPEIKLSMALVYNVVGPRITDVGTRAGNLILPDIEEMPQHALDFVGSIRLTKNLNLKLRGRNLLAQKRVLRQGSFTAQELDPGTTVSLGLGYEY